MSAKCKLSETCNFFNHGGLIGKARLEPSSSIIESYKKTYCLVDKNKECARYIVGQKVGREHVSESLFPNMHFEAEKIINNILK